MKGPARLIVFVGAISLAYNQADQKAADPIRMQPDLMMSESADETAVRVDTMTEKFEDIKYDKYNIVANPIDLPNLNSGMVYFATSLIIVAALLQLLNVFIFKKDVAWIVFLLTVGGFIAALFWDRNFQPHTEDLVRTASQVPEMQNWALWTVRTAFLAIILQLIHLSVTKFEKVFAASHHRQAVLICRRNRVFMSFVLIIMLSSAFCVVRAEHMGSKLVHNESIGLQFVYGR